MSHYMTALAMRQRGLKPAAKIVLYWLADHHNESTGLCFPSLKTLASECEMDKSTVIRHLSALEAAGLIERMARTRGDGSQASTEYSMRLTPVAECNSPCRKIQQAPVAKCDPFNLGSINLGTEQDISEPKNETSWPSKIKDGWTPDARGMAHASARGLTDEEIRGLIDDFQGYWSERTDAKSRKTERGWNAAWRVNCDNAAPRIVRARVATSGNSDATARQIAFAARAARSPSLDSF